MSKPEYLDNKVFTEEVCKYNRENAHKIFHKRFHDKFKKLTKKQKYTDQEELVEYKKYLKIQLDKIVVKSISKKASNHETRKEEIDLTEKQKSQIQYYSDIYISIIEDLKDKDTLVLLPYKQPNNIIGEGFLKISNNLSRKPSFFCYTFKDDLVADGVMHCIKYICNFSYYNSNAMSYFTSIIYGSFLRFISYEKRINFVKLGVMSRMIEEIEEQGIDSKFILQYINDNQ